MTDVDVIMTKRWQERGETAALNTDAVVSWGGDHTSLRLDETSHFVLQVTGHVFRFEGLYSGSGVSDPVIEMLFSNIFCHRIPYSNSPPESCDLIIFSDDELKT